MDFNLLSVLDGVQSSEFTSSAGSVRSSGIVLTMGDSLSLSPKARASWAANMAQGLSMATQEKAAAGDPVQVVQTAVTKTMDYLQSRLEKLIGGLNDGKFEGGLSEEMQTLAQKMQAAQDQDHGAQALRLLKKQSGELAEALGPALTDLLDDTRRYFAQSLTVAFKSLRIIDLTGNNISGDLLSLEGYESGADVETAAALVEKYDFIPASSTLDPSKAGEGILYESQNDPGLKALFESIEQSFNDELDTVFGDPDILAKSLDEGFMAQALAGFFKERRDGDPDMAQALGSGLESLLDRLTGDAGVAGLHETMDRNVKEAVENFKPEKGFLTTVTVVGGLDDTAMRAAKILDTLREILARDQQAKAEAIAQAKDAAAEEAGGTATPLDVQV